MVPGRQRCSGITRGPTIILVILACSLSAAGASDTAAETGNRTATTACTYSISPRQAIFDPGAGTGSFEVTTNLPDCCLLYTSDAADE